MSLSEAGPGLLGTYLTWEDLQQDFFEIYGPEAVLGEDKTVKDIADGRGFVSRIAMIDSLWKDQELAKDHGWPQKMAVKMVTLLQQQKYGHGDTSEETHNAKETLWMKVHNVESSIYEKLGDESDLAMLKVIRVKPFTQENTTKGYLLMEFVENVVTYGMDANLSDELVDQVLHALAKFHSKSAKFTAEEKETRKMGICTDMFGMMLHDNFSGPQLKKIGEVIGEETAEQMRKGLEQFRQPEYAKELDNMAENLGMERLLCHGDLWTVNMLFTQAPGESTHLKALIDYQICHFGCVGHDLARLFTSTLSAVDRKQKTEGLIQKYYHYLEESWPAGIAMPFTLKQLTNSYYKYLPFASFIVAVTISAIGEMTSKKTEDPAATWDRMKEKIKELAVEVEQA